MARKPKIEAWLPNDEAASHEHRLAGLAPDNMLAFMALLGLLRALEAARPEWRPRAFWDVETHPWRPILTLATPQTQAAVAAAAAEGVGTFRASAEAICKTAVELEIARDRETLRQLEGLKKPSQKELGEIKKIRNKIHKPRTPEKVTYLASAADEIREFYTNHNSVCSMFTSSLLAFEIKNKQERKAAASPLKLTSGQQAFAGLLLKLTTEPDADGIARSLFQPWLYKHRGDSFRFSGAEARRYAYGAQDPTVKVTEPGTTGKGLAPSERGANTLACLAFPSFPVISLRHGVAIPTQDFGDPAMLSFPLWRAGDSRLGASLSAIEAFLVHSPRETAPLPVGIVGWQVFRIVEIDDYKAMAASQFIAARA